MSCALFALPGWHVPCAYLPPEFSHSCLLLSLVPLEHAATASPSIAASGHAANPGPRIIESPLSRGARVGHGPPASPVSGGQVGRRRVAGPWYTTADRLRRAGDAAGVRNPPSRGGGCG